MRWADVQGNMVNVSRSINIHGEETRGKNDNAIRSFVLSGLARAVLEQQREITGARKSVFEISSELYYWKRWQEDKSRCFTSLERGLSVRFPLPAPLKALEFL